MGPNICSLCMVNFEYGLHSFVNCPFAIVVWDDSSSLLQFSHKWAQNSFQESLQDWVINFPHHREIPSFVCWGIWKTINGAIFEDKTPNVTVICMQIMVVQGVLYMGK